MKLKKYIVTIIDDGSRQSAESIRELECQWGADEIETCDDAISREAVLEYIEGSEAELRHSSENELVCQDIKNLPSVTPQQTMWIPCSERLPEEAGVYLVSMNRLGYPQREVDGFVCGRWERFGNDVIAWCEIPEPY